METTKNVRAYLKDGEVILKQYRAKTKTLLRSYPGTLCFTDTQLIWAHDDFGGFVSPWKLININTDNIRIKNTTLILPFGNARKTKITFQSGTDVIDCRNALVSMLKNHGPS